MKPVLRKEIANAVASSFEVTPDELTGASHLPHIVRARFAVWHLVREFLPETSLQQLGRMMNRDHSTAHRGLCKAASMISIGGVYQDFIDRIEVARSSLIESAGEKQKLDEEQIRQNRMQPPNACDPIGRHDEYFRVQMRKREARFLALMAKEYPDHVRVQVNEAAE